jgi:hypothetical protein
MRKLFFVLIILSSQIFGACSFKKLSGSQYITRPAKLTTKKKLIGEWRLDKVVYYDRFEETEQHRFFEFEQNNFFSVSFQESDTMRTKTNLFEVYKEKYIKLINMNTFQTYETMEIIQLSRDSIILKSIYPEDLSQAIFASRIHYIKI